jgi:DNA-binding transcriptional ArsR family regulator
METRGRLNDPKAMRALAHPARLGILLKLLSEGPATATEVAEAVGVTPSAASYHLRMLAKYDFVEDAPARGDGRERVWRATRTGVTVDTEPTDSPEVRAAKNLLIRTVHSDAASESERALAQRDRESPAWREASLWSRTILLIGSEEMKQLAERIEELIKPYRVASRDRGTLPDGARLGEAQVHLFARAERRAPGLPAEDHEQ